MLIPHQDSTQMGLRSNVIQLKRRNFLTALSGDQLIGNRTGKAVSSTTAVLEILKLSMISSDTNNATLAFQDIFCSRSPAYRETKSAHLIIALAP